MKYLNTYKLFESLVDRKVQLLKDISLYLQDFGLKIEVINVNSRSSFSGWNYQIYYPNDKDFITMLVEDIDNKIDGTCSDFFDSDIIKDFEEDLKSYGINFRSKTGGTRGVYQENSRDRLVNYLVYKFNKHGKMTDSPLVRT